MKRDYKCEYCGAELGHLHGNEEGWAKMYHFERNHSEEFKEIKDAYGVLKTLRNKYHYHTDLGLW